jgi:hypothetical protein
VSIRSAASKKAEDLIDEHMVGKFEREEAFE